MSRRGHLQYNNTTHGLGFQEYTRTGGEGKDGRNRDHVYYSVNLVNTIKMLTKKIPESVVINDEPQIVIRHSARIRIHLYCVECIANAPSK